MVAEFKTICVKGSEIKSNGASLTCVEIMHQYLIRNIKIEKGANDIKSIYHWPFMNSFIWRHEAAKKWLLVFDWKLLLRFIVSLKGKWTGRTCECFRRSEGWDKRLSEREVEREGWSIREREWKIRNTKMHKLKLYWRSKER